MPRDNNKNLVLCKGKVPEEEQAWVFEKLTQRYTGDRP